MNIDCFLDVRVVQRDLLSIRCSQDVLEDLSAKWIGGSIGGGGFNKNAEFGFPQSWITNTPVGYRGR